MQFMFVPRLHASSPEPARHIVGSILGLYKSSDGRTSIRSKNTWQSSIQKLLVPGKHCVQWRHPNERGDERVPEHSIDLQGDGGWNSATMEHTRRWLQVEWLVGHVQVTM